jgi:hypothetical protein
MTDCNAVANHAGIAGVRVQQTEVLDICLSADRNPLDVASNHGSKPNAGFGSNRHIA